ncbi:MAG: hypothetical protein ACP59X_23690 [Solidesulfovibrio sp. DCME]|uniref:hypothetical protein n=1 Tax=Solidesulfovibrio sp. DCME TaxID=3447380 RepID=UPI003D0F0CCE
MAPSAVTLTPLTGSAINDMIQEYMALRADRRREEMAQFLSNSRTVQSDIMAMTLRGMILSASA